MMRNRSVTAISTLVRWREFQEQRAAIELGQRSLETAQAAQGEQLAETLVDDVRQHLSGLLADSRIDLTRFQITAAIEDSAWQALQSSKAALVVAQQHQDMAQAAHLQTRASTRVAETREQHLMTIERDVEEKATFDRMAELYRPAKGLKR